MGAMTKQVFFSDLVVAMTDYAPSSSRLLKKALGRDELLTEHDILLRGPGAREPDPVFRGV